MVIGIDVRPLIGNKTSGVELYIKNLLQNLLIIDQENRYILYCNAAHLQKHIFQEFSYNGITIVHTRYPNKIFNIFLSFFRWPKLDKLILRAVGEKPDIFFVPDVRPSPVSNRCNKVTVVHDLTFHHFPHFFSKKTRFWHKLIKPVREFKESKKIITVSKATKDDLVKTFKIPKEKIIIVYQGIKKDFGDNVTSGKKAEIQKKYNLPSNFFLFLSTIEPRKNIQNLIEAFRLFKNMNDDGITLVMAGTRNPKIFATVPESYRKDIVFTGFIEEEDKAGLYALAKAFIYPSIFEGFGLPLLEAMKCETPIITSNRSSMPEVTNNAALLVDPESPTEIAAAMIHILNPKIAEELKSKMKNRIKNFSWEKCAKETLDVLRNL